MLLSTLNFDLDFSNVNRFFVYYLCDYEHMRQISLNLYFVENFWSPENERTNQPIAL